MSYQKDAVIRYKAHPDYWGGKALIDNLVFAITPDNSVRWAKLKAGECHVMPYPNPADVEAMRNDPEITVMQQEGLNVGYLAFNTEKKPFDNKLVRQALNYAVNKQAIIDAVFQGSGRLLRTRFRQRCGRMTIRFRTIRMILRRQRTPGQGRISERFRNRRLGNARATALQPQRQTHG